MSTKLVLHRQFSCYSRINVEDNSRKSRTDVSIHEIHDHLVEIMARYNSPELAKIVVQTRDRGFR